MHIQDNFHGMLFVWDRAHHRVVKFITNIFVIVDTVDILYMSYFPLFSVVVLAKLVGCTICCLMSCIYAMRIAMANLCDLCYVTVWCTLAPTRQSKTFIFQWILTIIHLCWCEYRVKCKGPMQQYWVRQSIGEYVIVWIWDNNIEQGKAEFNIIVSDP